MFKNRNIFTEDEARSIHYNALDLLANVGLDIAEEQCRDDMEKAGCRVEGTRVFFPQHLIKDTLKNTPSKFDMYDSFGKRYVGIGGDEVTIGPSGFAAFYLDWRDGQIKPSDYQGLMDEAKIIDVLDIPNYVKTSVQPTEKPTEIQDLWMAKGGLVYSRKPVHTSPFGQLGAEGLVEMAAEVMGGADVLKQKPHLIFNMCTLSPLAMREDMCESIRVAGKYGIPCFFTAGPMAGATSPVTIAAEVTQAWAEIVGHNAVLQIYYPGSPAIFASWSRIFDMRYSTCTVATPEYALMRAAITQLGKMANVPSGGGGFLTDSNTIDCQSGWEKFMTGLATMQAKQNTIWGLGMISQMNLFSHEQFVIDCEIAECIKRLLHGIDCGPEYLAYDELVDHAVDGKFLNSKHTRKHFKTEMFWADLTDRRMFQTWQKDEANNDIRKRACQKIERILDSWNYEEGLKKEDALDKIISKYEALHKK